MYWTLVFSLWESLCHIKEEKHNIGLTDMTIEIIYTMVIIYCEPIWLTSIFKFVLMNHLLLKLIVSGNECWNSLNFQQTADLQVPLCFEMFVQLELLTLVKNWNSFFVMADTLSGFNYVKKPSWNIFRESALVTNKNRVGQDGCLLKIRNRAKILIYELVRISFL